MKKQEWNEGLDHIDPKIVENYLNQKEQFAKQKRQRALWLRFGALAACVCLIFGAVVLILPRVTERPPVGSDIERPTDGSEHETNSQDLPIVNLQVPTGAPQYYGNGEGLGASAPAEEVNSSQMAVTAEWLETLPDTYTFFDDWRQEEFRLLRMKTVKLLMGKEITEEFYYIIPVDFMSDFSLFDRFVLVDMTQYAYEYSILYNKTQNKAEKMELVLFGTISGPFSGPGRLMTPYDANGNFDARLWQSDEIWILWTEPWYDDVPETLSAAEEKASTVHEWDVWNGSNEYRVHLLEDVKGEAREVLDYIASMQNELYVPVYQPDGFLNLSPQVDLQARRFINGFATNESVRIFENERNGNMEYEAQWTTARFTEEDLKVLPDLPSAMATVISAFEAGELVPPHIEHYKDLQLNTRSCGIIGWYAKTDDGVIGVVRVKWCYNTVNEVYLDDAYYVIEYGEDVCRFIERDALLERIGAYEKSFIYDGEYVENGIEPMPDT